MIDIRTSDPDQPRPGLFFYHRHRSFYSTLNQETDCHDV